MQVGERIEMVENRAPLTQNVERVKITVGTKCCRSRSEQADSVRVSPLARNSLQSLLTLTVTSAGSIQTVFHSTRPVP